MPILQSITDLFSKIFGFLDTSTKAKEEVEIIKAEISKAQIEIASKIIELEKQVQDASSKLILAESQGSWMQKNWRPISMFTFLGLIVLDSLNILPDKLSPQAWTLIQIGLGGYTMGRTAEKLVPNIMEGVGKKNA